MIKEIIEKLDKNREESLTKIIEAPDNERRVIGTYCTFAPHEIIEAFGAIPVSLCSTDDSTIVAAESHLPSDLCPLIKSSYGFALTDKCPYFHYADFIIGETTCDGKKKMYELLDEIKSTHVMQLPYDRTNKRSLEFWKSSIKELIEKLEEYYNMSLSNDILKKNIKINNDKRKAYRKIYEIMKEDMLPCKGKDIYKILSTADYIFDIEKVLELLDEAYKTIINKESIFKGARIVLTGCPIGKSTEKIIDAIEDNGGIVVFFENCTVSKEKHTLVDENMDQLDALAEHYLGIPCSCMSPNKERNERLKEVIEEYKVDGVIDMRLKFCHTYNVEGYGIEKYVEESLDIPYLGIETDYSQKDSGQLSTRIEAFLEML